MSLSSNFARIVALIGASAVLWRRSQGDQPAPAWGSAPVVPEAKPQGAIPTLKMPTAQGWSKGQMPVAASGLKVNAFATGLDHPRWINVLPNGDVLVAESTQVATRVSSIFSYAMQATMRRARALGEDAHVDRLGVILLEFAVHPPLPSGRRFRPVARPNAISPPTPSIRRLARTATGRP